MKQQYIYILISLSSYLVNVDAGYGQSISILFDGPAFTMSSSKPVDNLVLSQASGEHHPLYTLFYKYYFPSNIHEYKSIFYDSHYPAGIEDHYAVWRESMTGVTIYITGIINGLYKGYTSSILNFNYEKNGYSVRMSFFAKQIQGRWYPFEATELAEMHELNYFFPVFNPAIGQAMLSGHSEDRYKEVADAISERCSPDKRQLAAHCIYELAETWGIADQIQQRHNSEVLFLTRIKIPDRNNIVVDAESVKNSLQIPSLDEKEIKVITYYLNRGETMLAYSRIQHHAPGLQFEEINDKLSPVLKEQALQIQHHKMD